MGAEAAKPSCGLKIKGGGCLGVCLCGIRQGLACMTRATRKFPVWSSSPAQRHKAHGRAGRQTQESKRAGERYCLGVSAQQGEGTLPLCVSAVTLKCVNR